VGLSSSRVIYVECGDDTTVLACFEEGLRHKGLGAVVAEVARLSMTASRRLQLAAESSGTIGIAIRRRRSQTEAVDFGQPTAAVTALPSEALPVPGIRRARWQVELIRCRARRKRAFRGGAVRCQGSYRSCCRSGRQTGGGGSAALLEHQHLYSPRVRPGKSLGRAGRSGC
jgi:protein ImuA